MILALLTSFSPTWGNECTVDAGYQATIDKLLRMSRSSSATDNDPRLVKKTEYIEYRVAPLTAASFTLYVTVTLPNMPVAFSYLDIAQSGTLIGVTTGACADAKTKAHTALAELSSLSSQK